MSRRVCSRRGVATAAGVCPRVATAHELHIESETDCRMNGINLVQVVFTKTKHNAEFCKTMILGMQKSLLEELTLCRRELRPCCHVPPVVLGEGHSVW